MSFHAEDAHRLVPEPQRFSSMTQIGWWVLTDDITEYNRENEKLGIRAVINSGASADGAPFAYFELQKDFGMLLTGVASGRWTSVERCALEFFVMRGRFDSDSQWVTRYLKAFVVGVPSPFIWEPCAEPEEYAQRVPGTSSMIISENDRPMVQFKGFNNP